MRPLTKFLHSALLVTAFSSHAIAAGIDEDVQVPSGSKTLDGPALSGQRARGESESPPQDEIILTDTNNILTPRRRFIAEPTFTYTNTSSTQVAIEGFTVIPAIVIGLINVSQVQRDTFTAAMNLRYGLTDRLEVGIKIPYVYREVSVRQREALKGTPVDTISNSSGSGLGDVEASINYQFRPSLSSPSYWIANLQVKSDTGTDPFDMQWLDTGTEDGEDGTVTEPPGNTSSITGRTLAEQPTGSGFWSVQPGVSYIFQADPVVLYGSLSYLWNEERDIEAFGGVVDPGNAISAGFGMGVAFNSDMSFSLGYSHSTVKQTRFENDIGLEPSFSRFQVGSLRLGFSRRLTESTDFKLSLGIGLTDAAPDLQLGFSVPFTP